MHTGPTILVLDNDPPRHIAFSAAAPGLHVLQTYDIKSFKAALKESGPFALIALDHDLQSGVNADRECDDCGCDAAELIAVHGPATVPVVIHSGNASCSQVMRRLLVASGRRGRVSRVNIATIMEHGTKGGLETLAEEIQNLLANPLWPDDISTEELMEVLGDDIRYYCPVRRQRRSG